MSPVRFRTSTASAIVSMWCRNEGKFSRDVVIHQYSGHVTYPGFTMELTNRLR